MTQEEGQHEWLMAYLLNSVCFLQERRRLQPNHVSRVKRLTSGCRMMTQPESKEEQ